jgi:hypothetical protein
VSIAPIVRSVVVQAEAARAFEYFTSRMQDWWPRGRTIGGQPHVAVIMEPWVEGRWFERDTQGHEPLASGGTVVTLEHRHLERLGSEAARHRELLDGGWPTLLGEFQKITDGN